MHGTVVLTVFTPANNFYVHPPILNLQCIRQASLDTFFDGILSDPVKVGVIGCGCSVATEPVAEIIHHWNIPLV